MQWSLNAIESNVFFMRDTINELKHLISGKRIQEMSIDSDNFVGAAEQDANFIC